MDQYVRETSRVKVKMQGDIYSYNKDILWALYRTTFWPLDLQQGEKTYTYFGGCQEKKGGEGGYIS